MSDLVCAAAGEPPARRHPPAIWLGSAPRICCIQVFVREAALRDSYPMPLPRQALQTSCFTHLLSTKTYVLQTAFGTGMGTNVSAQKLLRGLGAT